MRLFSVFVLSFSLIIPISSFAIYTNPSPFPTPTVAPKNIDCFNLRCQELPLHTYYDKNNFLISERKQDCQCDGIGGLVKARTRISLHIYSTFPGTDEFFMSSFDTYATCTANGGIASQVSSTYEIDRDILEDTVTYTNTEHCTGACRPADYKTRYCGGKDKLVTVHTVKGSDWE